MNRADFMKTLGFGVAAGTVAPKVLFTKSEKKKEWKCNIQPAKNYIKDFKSNEIFVFEDPEGNLRQGKTWGEEIFPIDPENPEVITHINVGNFKPQKLFSAVGSTL